ncbi:gluconate 2-dehydrogenase subunit 3 family protein [Pedococcus bigeumensis]|uniref:gluconate 2-dehydrogenase subunit 3 family protein n=1 Tax=Pedococcus bigeumensis TaxID=433644 RepID=UPI002FED7769
MSLPLDKGAGSARYPGMAALSQSRHWDGPTTAVVMARVGVPTHIRFFTPHEEATANALCDQLLGQRSDPRVPVVHMIDSRLAEGLGDGWHHIDMPRDDQAWRDSLAHLDVDACEAFGCDFSAASWDDQEAVLRAVQRTTGSWHGTPAGSVWSLWTRYADTAFYSHPWAWDEIGFGGPAYPRGYKNLGLDAREPWEVADVRPGLDPLAAGSARGRS